MEDASLLLLDCTHPRPPYALLPYFTYTSILDPSLPHLLNKDRGLFAEYFCDLSYRLVFYKSRDMDVAEQFWGPMHFQVLPLPVAPGPVYSCCLQLGLLEYLQIPYTEYLSSRAIMESQTGGHFQGSYSASSWPTFEASLCDIAGVPDQAWQISTVKTLNGRNRYGSLGFVKRRFMSYKSLDLEDLIYIPNFCADDQPGLLHAEAQLQRGAESSRQVRPPHVIPQTLVPAPLADESHLSPQDITIPASRYKINNGIPVQLKTTLECNHSQSISFPNWGTSLLDQLSPWCAPAPPHAPLTPPSSTQGWSIRTPRRTDSVARKLMAEQERLKRQSGSGSSRAFIPSRVVQERNSPNPLSPYTLPLATIRSARDTNHYGRSDMPADQNCAIYIVGIPAEAQYSDVLTSIRGGKILICLIDPPNKQHPTAAAKIVFFTRVSAELFIQRSCGVGVYILGQRVRAMWNRIHYAAHTKVHQSRVILISGPVHLMDFEIFENFFRERFEFQEESRCEIQCDREGYAVYMWRFASLRAQAELAYIAIEREWRGIFRVEYGPDLCARPWM